MALSDFFQQLATIQAEGPAGVQPPQTALGGADRTGWLDVADGVPCLFRSLNVTLAAFSGRRNDSRQNQYSARIYFAADPVPEGLSSRHRIVVSGCPRAADNGIYAVSGAIDPNAMGRLLQVDVERVRQP